MLQQHYSFACKPRAGKLGHRFVITILEIDSMGRGDRKTRKGKTSIRSYGNVRPHKAAAKGAVATKKAAAPKAAPAKKAAPAVKKAAPKKSA
jgi:30S ribosomal protein S31